MIMADRRGAYLDASMDKRQAWARLGTLQTRLEACGLDDLFTVKARRGDASFILELVQYRQGPVSAQQITALIRMAHSGRCDNRG